MAHRLNNLWWLGHFWGTKIFYTEESWLISMKGGNKFLSHCKKLSVLKMALDFFYASKQLVEKEAEKEVPLRSRQQ